MNEVNVQDRALGKIVRNGVIFFLVLILVAVSHQLWTMKRDVRLMEEKAHQKTIETLVADTTHLKGEIVKIIACEDDIKKLINAVDNLSKTDTDIIRLLKGASRPRPVPSR